MKKNKFFKGSFGKIFISVLMGFIFGAIVLLIAGYNPIRAYIVMILGIFEKPKYIVQTIINSTPLILTGISVAFAYKTGLFNIGAEGQFIVGTIVAAVLGYVLNLPPVIHVIVIIIAAALAGGIWGGIAGYLKAKFGIEVVIITIMLNWIAYYFHNFVIQLEALKKPNNEATYDIHQSASTVILESWKKSESGISWLNNHPIIRDVFKTDMNWGFIVAIICAIIIWYILKKTTLGYELRSVGFNRYAAEYAGINVNQSFIKSMAIAGALAGIGGSLQVMGVSHRISNLAAMEGYGFNGIAVALIAGNSPIGCIFSGLLFSILRYGGSKIQYKIGAPTEIISIMIGIIILFIAMPKLIEIIPEIKNRYKKNKKAGEKHVD